MAFFFALGLSFFVARMLDFSIHFAPVCEKKHQHYFYLIRRLEILRGSN